MYSNSTPSAPLALTVRRYIFCHDQNAEQLADKSRLNLYYKAKRSKNSTFYLSLGFSGISGPALWLRTKQVVGNQGAEGLTQSGDGVGPRKLTLELSASCPWSSPEEQRTKSIKKGSGRRH